MKLSRAPYLFFLRTIFFSSAVVWSIFFAIFRDVGQPLIWALLFSSILLHQILCAFAVPFLPTIVELIWLVGNISGLAFYVSFEEIWWEVTPGASQLMVIHAVLSYYLVGALPLLALIRLASVFNAGFRTLVQRFDILAPLRPDGKPDVGGIGVLFGNSIWRSHFTGETKPLILARGSLAVLLLTGLAAFSFLAILTEPIRELGLVPTRIVHASEADVLDKAIDFSALTWGMIIMNSFDGDLPAEGPLAFFSGAVNVTSLWHNAAKACFTSGNNILELSQDTLSDLLVTVNFTNLGIPIGAIRDAESNSIEVFAAMTNNTDEVISMTAPTTLLPGVNLVGLVNTRVRQTFKNPGLSFFGLFESTESTFIGEITHVFPDPQAGISPLIIRSPEIATIRVILQDDYSDMTIIQDFKEKSFLNGLSQTGGLWTFLSGIFAAVFGSSLMRILFGIKPVSVFGLAHSWERKTIQRAYREEYPAITEEINVPKNQRGILCLLQDHIVDLNLTEATKEDFSAIPDEVELHDVAGGSGEA